MNSRDYDSLLRLWNKYGYATIRSQLDEWLDSEDNNPEIKQEDKPKWDFSMDVV